jgi:hypothetical protein
MRGGMIMVFNNLLKGRIDALCRELSGAGRLSQREPWHLDRRRPAQSRQIAWPQRVGSFDRRAGTFDGIFVTGILAVLLAGLGAL